MSEVFLRRATVAVIAICLFGVFTASSSGLMQAISCTGALVALVHIP